MNFGTILDLLLAALVIVSSVMFVRWAITERHEVDPRTMRTAITLRVAAVAVMSAFLFGDKVFTPAMNYLTGVSPLLAFSVALASLVPFCWAALEVTAFPSARKTENLSHRSEDQHAAL